MTTIHQGLDMNGLAGLGSGSADKTQAASGQAAQTHGSQQPLPGSQPSEVQITPAAQLLANVAQQISDSPDVDQGRVAAIRQALSGGTYPVDSSRIADGVLAAQQLTAMAAAGPGLGAQSNPVNAFAATAQLGSDPA